MKTKIAFASALAMAVLLATACEGMFTTPLLASLARKDLAIPANATTEQIVALLDTPTAATPEGAAAILASLSDKSADLGALTIEEKTAILDLALTATIGYDSLKSLATAATETPDDPSALLVGLFDSFDTEVDLTAVTALLSDSTVLAEAPVDTLVFAAACDLFSTIEQSDLGDTSDNPVGEKTTVLFQTLVTGSVPAASTSYFSESEIAALETSAGALDTLSDNRSAEVSQLTIGDVSIADYLSGLQS